MQAWRVIPDGMWQGRSDLRRLVVGLALTAVLMPLLTVTLSRFRDDLSFSSVVLIFLVAVVAISLVGRLWAATIGALVGSLLLNYYFTPPLHTWVIAGTENLLALLVFLLVAITISATVERSLRHAEEAAAAVPIAAADKLRTALLRAVSHDLRAPLASAKTAVQGLRTGDVIFDEQDRQELLATADESLDLLIQLVENLLDMSRLQAGALGVHLEPTSVAEVLPLAVDELGSAADRVRIQLDDDLPDVAADPALLQRVLANLLSNALKHSPQEAPPTITAAAHGGQVLVRVIDRGPGMSAAERDRAFLPFQRSGDTHAGAGIGLGLALSRGLAEAMGGSLDAAETPGGGLTMEIRLHAISGQPRVAERDEEASA